MSDAQVTPAIGNIVAGGNLEKSVERKGDSTPPSASRWIGATATDKARAVASIGLCLDFWWFDADSLAGSACNQYPTGKVCVPKG